METDYEAEQVFTEKSISLSNHNIQFRIFDSIELIEPTWSKVAEENIFFSVGFIKFVEKNPPTNYDQKYAIFERKGLPIGIALLQITHLRLSENLHYKKPKNVIEKLGNSFKSFLSGFIHMDTLICGNVLLTGEYGFHFSDRSLTLKEKFGIVEEAMSLCAVELKEKGFKIGPVLMKDFYRENTMTAHNVTNSKFKEFWVQPNMMLEMREWEDFDQYLMSMKSKSRVRAKSAFKKIKDLEKRELSLDEIEYYNDHIYGLYRHIAESAGFNLFFLPKNYFVELKKALQEKVKIVAYFQGEKLLSYYTIVISSDHMEAHYLGYDKAHNHKYQLYLNMLFDLIREGISCRTSLIQFARTALEIKSSIGAVPYDMSCYLMHSTPWKNKIVNKALGWFTPQEEWTPRSPFKS